VRKFPTTLFIVVLAVVCLVSGWLIFAPELRSQHKAVDAVRTSRSYVKVTMHIEYPHGPIGSEDYTLVDDDGVSRATYAVSDRKGVTATFDEPIRGYDVSFAFGKLVQDGIWKLDSRHARTLDDVKYTVHVEQTVTGQSGQRTVTFTNPEFWATAREFHIHLDPHGKTPSESDLLRMDSTATANPEYLAVVNDIRTFGSPTFKHTVAAARAKLLKS
jgi:hypothetical protein